MKTGTALALGLGIPLVLGGAGVGAYFIFRRKPVTATDVGVLQATAGSKAVAQADPRIFSANAQPGQVAPPKLSVSNVFSSAVGGAASLVDKAYPGVGSAAKSVVNTLAKPATSLLKKIPGIGSLF